MKREVCQLGDVTAATDLAARHEVGTEEVDHANRTNGPPQAASSDDRATVQNFDNLRICGKLRDIYPYMRINIP